MSDDLGDRMKLYEMAEAGRHLIPLLPIIARIDGRSFHSFTQGLERPYDERLLHLMQSTAKYIAEKSGALTTFVQSDEITLVWHAPDYKSQTFFNGRIQKLTSVLASMTSAYFNHVLSGFLPVEYAARLPHFDCRVWNVPNLEEAANALLWRELDATKNSIAMAASAHYSHKQLYKKNGKEMQEMLFLKGINWNDYPADFKRGAFVRKIRIMRKFTTEELGRLPLKHEARTNPDLEVERSEWRVRTLPRLSTICNRVGTLFQGEEPRIYLKDQQLVGPEEVTI